MERLPINHFSPGKVSNVSFIVANLWMGQASIIYALTGYGAISHQDHVFWWAFLMAGIIGMFKWSQRWWLGAVLGSTSHIVLDMLVHADMSRVEPFLVGNPFYRGLMEPLSAVLLVLCVWLIAQYVAALRKSVQSTVLVAKKRITRLLA